jgi:hypothetical protein
LYHRASCMQADGRSPTDRWYQLQTTIDGIIFRSRDATGMGEALLREIEEQQERDRPRDGELLDLLTSCLGPEYYEKLRELLQKKETTP